MLEGGFLCGAVRWTTKGAPKAVHHCHCPRSLVDLGLVGHDQKVVAVRGAFKRQRESDAGRGTGHDANGAAARFASLGERRSEELVVMASSPP